LCGRVLGGGRISTATKPFLKGCCGGGGGGGGVIVHFFPWSPPFPIPLGLLFGGINPPRG